MIPAWAALDGAARFQNDPRMIPVAALIGAATTSEACVATQSLFRPDAAQLFFFCSNPDTAGKLLPHRKARR